MSQAPTPTSYIEPGLKALRAIRGASYLFLRSPKKFMVDLNRYVSTQTGVPGKGPKFLPEPKALPWVKDLHLRIDPALDARPHFNIVLPAMAMKAMSGGPNTVIQLGYRMARLGVPVRFISGDFVGDSNQEALWNHFSALTGIRERIPHVQIKDGCVAGKPLAIGSNDVFCASAWWTAQKIKMGLRMCKPKKFIYVIQDFEPGLHSWSSEYALAMETYGMNYRAVINSRLLADHFVADRVGNFQDPGFIQKCAVLDVAIDREKFSPPSDLSHRRRRRLLFYARPIGARRNLFELGLYALRIAAEQGIFNDAEWELNYMGETLAPTTLSAGKVIRSVDWLDFDAYARLMRESDVALSLMLSPHSSYPPLEMAACGGLVVTNTYGVKTAERLRAISSNMVPVEATVEGIVAGLKEAVSRVGNLDARVAGSRIQMPGSWDDAFAAILPQVMEMWDDCLQSRS